MRSTKNEKLIFDNATLSNFARIQRLKLILHFSRELYITREVLEEVERGVIKRPKLGGILELVESKKLKVASAKQNESILFVARLAQEGVLGAGEISAMALAREFDGIFITDDEVATRKALKFGVKILDDKEFRDTVLFLGELRARRVIFPAEYLKIKEFLKQENFDF